MGASQNILITGAGAGFGALFTRTFLANGHTVIATMRDLAGRNKARARALEEYAAGKPGRLRVLELDVTDDASVDAAFRRAAELEGGLDAVINNAGGGHGLGAYGEALSMDQFRRVFDLNVFGVQRVIRAALPGLRKRGGGLILNVSSIMGRIVLPYSAAYTASKFAVEGLSESYRYELSGLGVEVSMLEPGGFPTEFFNVAEAPEDKARLAEYGPLADIPGKLYAGFGESIGGPEGPNPQLVADAALRIVEAPRGQRPLRVVVDPLMGGKGPEAINRATEGVQEELLAALGQSHLGRLGGLD